MHVSSPVYSFMAASFMAAEQGTRKVGYKDKRARVSWAKMELAPAAGAAYPIWQRGNIPLNLSARAAFSVKRHKDRWKKLCKIERACGRARFDRGGVQGYNKKALT